MWNLTKFQLNQTTEEKNKNNNCLNELNELQLCEVSWNLISNGCWKFQLSILKFGFSKKATKFEKIFEVLSTRASCSVRTKAYLSKSWRRFFKTNVVKSYYTDFKNKKSFIPKKNIFLAVVSLNMPREVQKMALAVLIFSEGFERTYIKVH